MTIDDNVEDSRVWVIFESTPKPSTADRSALFAYDDWYGVH